LIVSILNTSAYMTHMTYFENEINEIRHENIKKIDHAEDINKTIKRGHRFELLMIQN